MATPITICGNLTGAPELRFTPSGTAVANLNIAVNHRRKNPQTQEWEDAGTDFYGVAVWQKQGAENVAGSLDKGMEVIVTGRLKSRSYETKEGEKRTVVELDVDEVGPSLRYASAKVTKAERGGSGGGFGGQGGFQQQDPWATGGSAPAPQGGQGWGGQQAPQQPQGGQPAPQQPQGGQQGGWGQAPSYDEPPF